MFLYETGYSPADGLDLGLVETWGPGFFFQILHLPKRLRYQI